MPGDLLEAARIFIENSSPTAQIFEFLVFLGIPAATSYIVAAADKGAEAFNEFINPKYINQL